MDFRGVSRLFHPSREFFWSQRCVTVSLHPFRAVRDGHFVFSLMQVPSSHPESSGERLPGGGGRFGTAAALPGSDLRVALPALAAQLARRSRQTAGMGSCVRAPA